VAIPLDAALSVPALRSYQSGAGEYCIQSDCHTRPIGLVRNETALQSWAIVRQVNLQSGA
jgi:hypothetical protein